jgi:hypothetical protein
LRSKSGEVGISLADTSLANDKASEATTRNDMMDPSLQTYKLDLLSSERKGSKSVLPVEEEVLSRANNLDWKY